MTAIAFFTLAGLLEIGGGYLVWQWLREGKSFPVGIAGFLLLAGYGVVPTFQPKEHPFGRIYAAYGAVFIVLSVLWGWSIDDKRPDHRDLIGAMVSTAGALIMMWPRKT